MRRTLTFSVLIFLIALAVQARLVRPGDLTPTWPLIAAVVLGAAFALSDRWRAGGAPRT